MTKFDRFVAGRYLRAKRKQAFIGVISTITLAGITLGVAALNTALAIHNGMRAAFLRSLIGETGELYLISTAAGQAGFSSDDLDQIRQIILEYPAIKAVSMLRQEAGVLVSREKQLAFTSIRGISPQDHLQASSHLRHLIDGSVSDLENRGPNQPPGIILGADLAHGLGVGVGDSVRLLVPRLASPGLSTRNISLKSLNCEVTGVFQTGNSQFDRLDAYLMLPELMGLLNTTSIQSVLLGFESVAAMDKVKLGLLERPDMPDFTAILDLRDLNRGLLHALKLEKVATTAVIGLFILIVALNMVSALIMLVMEKHRDIGIMKAFGTPKHVIWRIFIRQGMTLSVWGTLLGTVIGVSVALIADSTQLIKLDNAVYEVLNYLPFKVNPVEVGLVALGSLLLAFASSLYPAVQAAALDPVEALKYD